MEDILDPALLVIDAQNYFFNPGMPAHLPGSARIVAPINRLMAHAAARGWPIYLTSHRRPSGPENLMAKRWDRLPRGKECDIYNGLDIPPRAARIEKEHYSAFHETRLRAILNRKKVKTIVMCGVMTHLCVDTTARHGFMLGFVPVVVGDACCSKDRRFHREALRNLAHGFAEIVTVRDVIGKRR